MLLWWAFGSTFFLIGPDWHGPSQPG
jgi:hypothetical protein